MKKALQNSLPSLQSLEYSAAKIRKNMVIDHPTMSRPLRRNKRSLADDLSFRESPGSGNTDKHVVIVMDGLKDFTIEPLEWALNNITTAGFTVTLLGLMPWLNIPLSSKTWRDVWTVEFEDFNIAKEKNSEWKRDTKYLKLQAVVDLCKKYEVLPQKEVVMGYPPRLLLVERIISLHPTWVIFDSDRYHKKNREFYAKRIPFNMVMMNEEGGFEMIKRWPMIDNEYISGESPVSLVPTPQLIISERLKVILEETEAEEADKD